MDKLSGELLTNCNTFNCCQNEFVILPKYGDVGFYEYYKYKAELIRKKKRLFCPENQTELMLAYPPSDSTEAYIFERFFESPFVVACNHDFEGCFAIDISNYINKLEDAHFLQLLTYMHENNNTVYLLFVYTDNKNEIDAVYNYLSQFDEYRKTVISLPSPKTLSDYTVMNIRNFSLHVKSSVSGFLYKYYEQNPCGFEKADYIVRYLKNEEYNGNLPEIKRLIKEIDDVFSKGNSAEYGY